MKTVSLKVEDRQLKLLKEASRISRIPTSVLIRQGIDLVLERMRQKVASQSFRRDVKALLQQDHELLKRLAK